MRKNPYNKDLEEHFPLFMQRPSATTALIANETQKAIVEKTRPLEHEYSIEGISFTMVQPPFVNRNGTPNPQLQMGQTEVTQELFQAVMGFNPSHFEGRPKNPVETVTWYDCVSFCNELSELLGLQPCYKMKRVKESEEYLNSIESAKVVWKDGANGFRLPTEMEWQTYAEAGTNNTWAGTNNAAELVNYAWYFENSGNRTHPVGELSPNEWGLYDMSGNVSEWCWDEHHHEFNMYLIGRASLGGSWNDSARGLRFDCRSKYLPNPGFHLDHIGFRICRNFE